MITLAIPVYNGALFIEKTLESIASQTYSHFEVLIYDNASTDETVSLVKKWCEKDLRFKLFTSELNHGPGYNWNRCLSQVSGKYFKLICADDIIYPTLLEKQVIILDQYPNVGLVSCKRDIIDADSKRVKSPILPKPTGLISGKKAIEKVVTCGTNFIGEPMCGLVRSSLLKRVNSYRDTLGYVIDVDFWVRLLALSDLYILDEFLCAFRISSRSWSSEIGNKQYQQYQDFIDVIQKEQGISPLDAWIGKKWARILCLVRGFVFKASFLGALPPNPRKGPKAP